MDYSPEVQRRFADPEHAGALARDTPGVYAGEAEDRALNVWVRFHVEVREGVIRVARFQVYGCPHTVAAASCMAERLEGRPLEVLGRSSAREVAAALEVPVEKLGKLLRLEDALQGCLRAAESSGSQRHAHDKQKGR